MPFFELDLFGRVRRSIEAASANAASAAAARDALKVVTVAETARFYAQVCALGEQLKVAEHSLERPHEEGLHTEIDRTAENEQGDSKHSDVERGYSRSKGVTSHVSFPLRIV